MHIFKVVWLLTLLYTLMLYRMVRTRLSVVQGTTIVALIVVGVELTFPILAHTYDTYGIIIGSVLGSVATARCLTATSLRRMCAPITKPLTSTEEADFFSSLASICMWCVLKVWTYAPLLFSEVWTSHSFSGAVITLAISSFIMARYITMHERAVHDVNQTHR